MQLINTTEARELANALECTALVEGGVDRIEAKQVIIAACGHIEQLQRGIEMVQYGGGLRGFDPQHDSLLERITKLGEEHNP